MKAKSLSVGNILLRIFWRKVTDYCPDRLFGILGECKIAVIIFSR
jgi:hypothetical protein